MDQIMNRISELRNEKRLSLDELSEMLGKSASTVERYESGLIANVPADVLLDISTMLEVPLDYLMGWSNSRVVHATEIPVIEHIIDGDMQSHSSIELLLSTVPDYELYFFEQKDYSIYPFIKEGSLLLTKDYTDAHDGSLVVVLPEGETSPVVRLLKYLDEKIIFITNDNRTFSIYSEEQVTVLGDVILSDLLYQHS